MKLILYKCNDANNVIGKVKENPIIINIKPRNDFNIFNPVIRLTAIDESENLTFYNYAEIEDIKRFYFIDEIKQVQGLLFELRLSTDLLETYRDNILSSNARVKRNIKIGDKINVNLDELVTKSYHDVFSDVKLETDNLMILSTLGSRED